MYAVRLKGTLGFWPLLALMSDAFMSDAHTEVRENTAIPPIKAKKKQDCSLRINDIQLLVTRKTPHCT